MLTAVGLCVLALLMDHCLGEPRRFHPLIAFGTIANALETKLNRPGSRTNIWRGMLAATILLVPAIILALAVVIVVPPLWLLPLEVLVLYLAVGMRSLADHAQAVVDPLKAGSLTEARMAVANMVSRDTELLDDQGVARAATESVLENGSDAVIASLFWFLVAGLPGLILHRLVNTLDAMWGYRNERFNHFGRVVARLDDLMGLIPARLTALAYALSGHARDALLAWRQQAGASASPNAGPVMAAGAGALGFSLGGPTPYHGRIEHRPILGLAQDRSGPLPLNAPWQAVRLLRRAVVIILSGILLGAATWAWITAGV